MQAAAVTLDPTRLRDSHTLPGTRCVLACRIDPSGRYVVAGGMQLEITHYQFAADAGQVDWSKAGPFLLLTGHKAWVCAMAFRPDGKRFFSADYAGVLQAWDFPAVDVQHKPVWSQPAHQGWIRAVAVSPDGKLLATCGNDHAVRLWSTADGRLVHELKSHNCHVYNVLFHPDSTRLLSGDLQARICEWDVATGTMRREVTCEGMWVKQMNLQLGGVRSMATDAQGKQFALGGMYGFGSIGDGIGSLCVSLFDWEKLEKINILRAEKDQRSFVNGIHFHPSGLIIGQAGGLDGGWLVFWKPGEVISFHQHKLAQSGWAMDVHPDGQHLAVAHHDNCLRFYDLAPPTEAAKG